MSYRLIHKSFLAFLAQKAKMSWCKDGEENKSLFHQSIKRRKVQNTVYAINDMNGHWQDNLQAINQAFLAYYKQRLGSPMLNKTKVKRVVIEKGPE